MTLNSTRAFVRKAGFEIERAEFMDRSSGIRFVLVVGRKPPVPLVATKIDADDPRRVRRRLVSLYRLHLARAPLRMIERRVGKEPFKTIQSKVRRALRDAQRRASKLLSRVRA